MARATRIVVFNRNCIDYHSLHQKRFRNKIKPKKKKICEAEELFHSTIHWQRFILIGFIRSRENIIRTFYLIIEMLAFVFLLLKKY